MAKQDLRNYSEHELSLQVFNTESLYKARKAEKFLEMLAMLYYFTDEQLKVLVEDLEMDAKGYCWSYENC